jgi:glycine cleavage system H protein
MNFPQNLKYTNEHEWIRVDGDIAYVGITDYAQEQLGDIVFVDIPTVGETLEAGETFGTIEVVKTISDLFLPIAGEVLEQNEALEENPELVNKDPWLRSPILMFIKFSASLMPWVVRRTYSPPASTIRFACSTQACVSCVDVFVIDWTRIELGPPNGTAPIFTSVVSLRK